MRAIPPLSLIIYTASSAGQFEPSAPAYSDNIPTSNRNQLSWLSANSSVAQCTDSGPPEQGVHSIRLIPSTLVEDLDDHTQASSLVECTSTVARVTNTASCSSDASISSSPTSSNLPPTEEKTIMSALASSNHLQHYHKIANAGSETFDNATVSTQLPFIRKSSELLASRETTDQHLDSSTPAARCLKRGVGEACITDVTNRAAGIYDSYEWQESSSMSRPKVCLLPSGSELIFPTQYGLGQSGKSVLLQNILEAVQSLNASFPMKKMMTF
ncbi:unnamed protein product [Protopolystoma xenopodis]|uniref:Uncharacterized protein n=1 Tax=Protopolystoma xenopodis TaxID=117903 RepID=A0A3S5BEB4_9PLAT|nr:unnamed protein product [Protopolystoma xenopodis]